MRIKESPVLILGASGFIGSYLTAALLKDGWRVRAFSRRFDTEQKSDFAAMGELEVIEASIFDETALDRALQDVSTVINLVTFSVPSTSPVSLQNELNTTLQALSLLLSQMIKNRVKHLIFPSSGGTIYGNLGNCAASERDLPAPVSSYGMGKLLCEEMIRFHHRVHGLEYLILRISNPYGAGRIRRVSQGVIDVFLEQIRAGQALCLWGGLDNVRDYIFIDDLIEIMLNLLELEITDSLTLNIGSGRGTTLRDLLSIITQVTGYEPEYRIESGNFAGIPYNVLDIARLQNLTGWEPAYTIEEGISEAWRRKQFPFQM